MSTHDPSTVPASDPPAERELRDWLSLIATLISTAVSVLAPLTAPEKIIAISIILWIFCCYLRIRQIKPANADGKPQYMYPSKVRDGAYVGLISIPSLLLGTFGLSLLLWPKETSTPVVDRNMIDTMDELSHWAPSFCDPVCGGSYGPSALVVSSVPGKTNNAVEIIYDLKKSGWVLITRNIDPNVDRKILSRTDGIGFAYKSAGTPITIELKLLLRYPGDTEDTVFGASWKADTGGNWTRVEARYDKDITCWWPDALCQKHGNLIELTALKRIDLAISNKLGDREGLGRVTFDDLVGITP